jgi:hypothetical protein
VFGIKRKKLINNIENIRKRLCCYMGPRCDCKYGGTGQGESTGCPELYMVLNLLTVMTEKQFKDLCNKAKIIMSEEFIKSFNKSQKRYKIKQENNREV